MSYKKAQSGVITTILIILLVLAAIVIVWQVVNSTLKGGAEEIEKQSDCIGLTMEITNIVSGATGSVTIRPSKAITGYRVYVAGSQLGSGDGAAKGAFETATVTGNVPVGSEVESAGKIGSEWCSGKIKETAK